MSVVTDTGARAPLPPFGPEHEHLRETVARWVREEILPHADEWERERGFPRELYRRAGELGFFGITAPAELGGQGGDVVHAAVFAEEMAAAGAPGGVAAGLGAHAGIAMPPILAFGTADQHERYLRPAIRGERIAALGITEPGGGSDVAAVRTRATPVEGGWEVSGSKTFITGGCVADFLVCACRTTPEGGHGGMSFLILERETPGYSVARKLEKLGWHSSDTAELSFDSAFVPRENLLGAENQGFALIMENFAWERLAMALGAVGTMRWLLERAVAYCGEREAFGRPIGRNGVIRAKVAEMATKLEAGRAVTYSALRRHAAGEECIREVTIAKLQTQRAAVEVADECLQIHGGYGYMTEYGIERALRDARLGPIGGGTDEIMKEILGRRMGF